MNILLNGERRTLAHDTTLADAIALLQPAAPFAAAVNREFVPRSAYAQHQLNDGDDVEVIRPVTGG